MIKDKGHFQYWKKTITEPKDLFQGLREHYINLSTAYAQKGMKREAELFADTVKEFEKIEQEIKKLQRITPSKSYS